jgi:hypothetical protein
VEFVRFTNRALHIHGQARNGEGGRTDARLQVGRATALLKTNGNTHGNNPTTIRHYDNNNNNNNTNNNNDPATQHQPNNNPTTPQQHCYRESNNNPTTTQHHCKQDSGRPLCMDAIAMRRATALLGCSQAPRQTNEREHAFVTNFDKRHDRYKLTPLCRQRVNGLVRR